MQQLMSELCALRMGHCGHGQLSLLPKCIDGTPAVFVLHPFRFNDSKEQARVQKQPIRHDPEKAPAPKMRFFMDFGFMCSSHSDYRSPQLGLDRVVECFKGYSAYLIIVDKALRYVWVFLRKSKEPLIDLALVFLAPWFPRWRSDPHRPRWRTRAQCQLPHGNIHKTVCGGTFRCRQSCTKWRCQEMEPHPCSHNTLPSIWR
jgi:hypothetical protein